MNDSRNGILVRRHVRRRCVLILGDNTIEGWTGNISLTGCFVVVPLKLIGDNNLTPGTHLKLSLDLLPNRKKVEVSAEIVWSNPKERDFNAHPCLGMGLKFFDGPAGYQDELKTFVDSFKYSIVVLEDDEAALQSIGQALEKDYHIIRAQDEERVGQCLDREDVSVLIVGQHVTDSSGAKVFSNLSKRIPYFPVLIVLGHDAKAPEIQELDSTGKLFMFAQLPIDAGRLKKMVHNAIDMYAASAEYRQLNKELEDMTRRLKGENAYLRQRISVEGGFDQIIGTSDALQKAIALLERVRHTDVAVHVEGETGTGKELVARALHAGGTRAKKPFIVQNCAGMTETLLQSALFGHQKGSFTGAESDRPGVFQEADGGTLFLDEVAELSPKTQGMLLRALQYGEIIPVGADRPTKVNVRLISATHKDLRQEVTAERFREDLFFRLFVISIRLPPLRERKGDIVLLARHFLELYAQRYAKRVLGFAPQTMELFEVYLWPGNIRELEHEIERAVVLADEGKLLTPELLSRSIRQHQKDVGVDAGGADNGQALIPFDVSLDEAMDRLQKLFISRALDHSNGVISKAARILGVDRSRLSKIKQRLGI